MLVVALFGARWFLEYREYKQAFPDDSPKIIVKDVESGKEEVFSDGKQAYIPGIENGTGSRKVTNIDHGYSFIIPDTWSIEGPADDIQQSWNVFRLFPDEKVLSSCGVVRVGGLKRNPNEKTYEDLLKNEQEESSFSLSHSVEQYQEIQGAYLTTIIEESEFGIAIAKEIAIPTKGGFFLLSIPIPSDTDSQKECSDALGKIASTVSFVY